LSQNLKEEYKRLDWEELYDVSKIGDKDLPILKLYFTLLGYKVKDDTEEFLDKINAFIINTKKEDIAKIMDPEKHFDFSEPNVLRVRKLLCKLEGKITETNLSNNKLFSILATVIQEALNYKQTNSIPLQNKLTNIHKEIKKCNKFIKLIHNLISIIQL